MSWLYSPVFTGVCLSLTLITYTAIKPGWHMVICMAAVLAVAISSLIITLAALCLFEFKVPHWVKYLLLFCLVTQWHIPWAILEFLEYRPSFDTILELMAGGVAYFFWPVLGVLLGRNLGQRYSWFSPLCWLLSILLLFSCFLPVAAL